MGFAVPVLLAVLLMFKSRRKYTMLKTYFIISAVMICIPFFGQAMNGFSYMCNRWIYSFALLCAYILVCMMPRLITLERKRNPLYWNCTYNIFCGMYVRKVFKKWQAYKCSCNRSNIANWT